MLNAKNLFRCVRATTFDLDNYLLPWTSHKIISNVWSIWFWGNIMFIDLFNTVLIPDHFTSFSNWNVWYNIFLARSDLGWSLPCFLLVIINSIHYYLRVPMIYRVWLILRTIASILSIRIKSMKDDSTDG